ncbi:hypothetical protein ABZT06_08640 [Streptomyces sp. NPDC005483]|uniref:hypothetical protein n=1 Tax=Streptomyces sp. NPDC005483 TaxID=3154882 RepID=UPI0033B10582
MTEISVEDIAELRRQGDFRAYLRQAVEREATQVPKPPLAAVPTPGYRVAHTGGWPLGTAATGPTPPPDTCTCARCGGNPAASASVHHHRQGDAA